MRKVTLAFAMLPLLASAPVLAASVSSQQGQIQLAQAGNPGGDQFAQQVCNLAHQNAQSYARILQLRDKMLKIQRDNETRFQALEKGRGGAQNHVSIGSTAILDDAMRDNGAGGQGGYQQSPGLQQEVIRNLTGKVEDVDAQISFTNEQLQKTQDDNQFRFEELEKKRAVRHLHRQALVRMLPLRRRRAAIFAHRVCRILQRLPIRLALALKP